MPEEGRCGDVEGPALRVVRFATPWLRVRGLLGRPPPPAKEAVWLFPCRRVHTLGMRYAIDVVHLDRAGVVLGMATVAPGHLGPRIRGTHSILELAAGEAVLAGIVVGTTPCLIEVGADATKKSSTHRTPGSASA